jgi:hypothetical protein
MNYFIIINKVVKLAFFTILLIILKEKLMEYV